MISPASTPSVSVSQLQRQVRAQQEEIARLHRLMEKKEAEWEAAKAALFEQFRLAIERQFGPSTEKYRVEQGGLLINEAEVAVDEEEDAAMQPGGVPAVEAFIKERLMAVAEKEPMTPMEAAEESEGSQ